MTQQDFDWYKFFVDVVIPVGTFVIGLIAEKKWNITKLFIKDQSKTFQDQSTSGENNSPIQVRDNFGVITVGGGIATSTPETLPYKEEAFITTIVSIFQTKNIESSFGDRYRDGYKHLKNNCASLAASAYLSVFSQIRVVFGEPSNYRDDVNRDLVSVLEGGLANLKSFSDESKDNAEDLRKIINGIENALGALFAYIK
jgi:hypothetical protein